MSLTQFGSFRDPVVGGLGTLIRREIRSPDYVPGVSGWIIRRDGSAEFNNVNIRGEAEFGNPTGQRVEITNTGQIKIYNSSNQLVAELDATGLLVQDPSTAASVALRLAYLDLLPPAVIGHVFGSGRVTALSDAFLADAWSEITSPVVDGGTQAAIRIYGQNPGMGSAPQIALDADLILVGGGLPLGYGLIDAIGATANSAAINTTETAVLTTAAMDLLDKRAYRIEWGPNLQVSTVGRTQVRVRKNTTAGQLLGLFLPELQTAATPVAAGGACHIVNLSGATITAAIALTLQSIAGTTIMVGAATAPRFVTVTDIGAANAGIQLGAVSIT